MDVSLNVCRKRHVVNLMPMITTTTIKATEPVRGTLAPIHPKADAAMVMGRRQMVVAQTIVMHLTSTLKKAGVVAGMIMAT